MTKQHFACILIAAIALLIPLSLFAEPNLNGKWKLNKKESDDPMKKFRNGTPPGGMGRGPGGGGFPGGAPGRGGGPMPDRMKAAEEITIQYDPPEFKITDKEGKERKYYTDGRETELEGREGRKLKAKAKVDEEQILIESSTPDGGSMTEAYYLSPNADRLYIKLRMKPIQFDEAVTIVRVYDRMQ